MFFVFLSLLSLEHFASNIQQEPFLIQFLSKDKNQPIEGVVLKSADSVNTYYSDKKGFVYLVDTPDPSVLWRVSHKDYYAQRWRVGPTSLSKGTCKIYLKFKKNIEEDIGYELQDSFLDLNDGEEMFQFGNQFGAYQTLLDKLSAFQWRLAFFSRRGLDQVYQSIDLSGFLLTDLLSSRPNWSVLSGLNDLMRDRVLSYSFNPNHRLSQNLFGTTAVVHFPNEQAKKMKLSYASSNGNYKNRLLVTSHSGNFKKLWSLSATASLRTAKTGHFYGTPYRARSFGLVLDRSQNTINSQLFVWHNEQYKALKSSLTNEVLKFKSERYNPNWGWYNNQLLPSKYRVQKTMGLVLSHSWQAKKLVFKNALLLNRSKTDNNSLSFRKAPNPSPIYYKKLPSYALRNVDFPNKSLAYDLQIAFDEKGQVLWDQLIKINKKAKQGHYYILSDRADQFEWAINQQFDWRLNSFWDIYLKMSYSKNIGQYYATVSDPLFGLPFAHTNPFERGTDAYYNLNEPEKVVLPHEPAFYHFNLNQSNWNAQFALRYRSKKWLVHFNVNYFTNTAQRLGYFKNGQFPNDSYGKSTPQSFKGFMSQFFIQYLIDGRNKLDLSLRSGNQPQPWRKVFYNLRNHHKTSGLSNEKQKAINFHYSFRGLKWKSNIHMYGISLMDRSQVSYFFGEAFEENEADFVTQVLRGVGQYHLGIEWSNTFEITPDLKLNSALALGQYFYAKNPELLIESSFYNNHLTSFGYAQMKGLRIAQPQNAISFGLSYRSPKYWWFETYANGISNRFVAVAPIRYTSHFVERFDFSLNENAQNIHSNNNHLNQMLKQKTMPPIWYFNLVGGKSFKMGSHYLSFFMSVQNVLDLKFSTGGFESSRKTTFSSLKEDTERPFSLFGPRYWTAMGRTYFMMCTFQF